MKFRDTKRSYNIINHSKGPGVSLSASEHHGDQCPLGHDLTALRRGVSDSLPIVSLFIRSFMHSFTSPLLVDHLPCAHLCWPVEKDQQDKVLAFRELREHRCVRPVRTLE